MGSIKRSSNWFSRATLTSWFLTGALVTNINLLVGESAHALTLYIEPANQNVTLGSPFVFNVWISGLGSTKQPSLGAFDFDLKYDPTKVAFDGISFGDPLLGDQLAPLVGSIQGFANDSANGLINQFEVSFEMPATLDALQPESFILTRLTFDTIGTGISTIDILNLVLADSQGVQLIPDEIKKGSLNISTGPAVPDSGSSMLLLGLAIAALCSIRSHQPS